MSDKLMMNAVRRSNRFRVIMNLPLKLGWKPGTLVDISEAGVLATHTGVLKTGSTIDISFTYEGQQFVANARVETCTVVGLGAGPGGATLYASRLFFNNLTDGAKAILSSLVGSGMTEPILDHN
ncbi:MAG TPA: hypothetical protein VGQ76_20770 [Thermoanaerobaculia bacterium]|jgi:hypothetical protein|nr:hypothetical protein [Thermoanaerobaculia bacterium]